MYGGDVIMIETLFRIPEPVTLMLLGAGLIGLGTIVRRTFHAPLPKAHYFTAWIGPIPAECENNIADNQRGRIQPRRSCSAQDAP